MQSVSPDVRRRYDALVRAADSLVVGLDFDGTLAPIVDDPAEAALHPAAAEALTLLGARIRAVAVVTGRPVRQVLDLGALEEVGAAFATEGSAGPHELLVLGQYGNERWSSTSRTIVSAVPPPGLAAVTAELPRLLADLGLDPWIEEKGLAVAVHTRRMPQPEQAFAVLLPALTRLAHAHGLQVEPGRLVIEVRAPGMDKGRAVRRLVAELDPGGFCFAGDDLGDVEAFEAVRELSESGMPTLLVCSGSREENALVKLADVVVPGPDGVVELLRGLVADIDRQRG
ncbi:trehalose-phosphatase [Nocardioides terrisoli]|uniref:trehalose-phosphatase n=1 Tax=Nocardioides terrisoli TaxID=3388267 RepID=UPI00287B98F0|nr:trehalose-phosphatase [Nocardioides marmorisolisilvae]